MRERASLNCVRGSQRFGRRPCKFRPSTRRCISQCRPFEFATLPHDGHIKDTNRTQPFRSPCSNLNNLYRLNINCDLNISFLISTKSKATFSEKENPTKSRANQQETTCFALSFFFITTTSTTNQSSTTSRHPQSVAHYYYFYQPVEHYQSV